LTDYPNPDVADNQINTRLRRAVKASFTANQGPYGRDKFTKHLNDLGILEELETCGATAQRNTFILTFATIRAAEEFKRAGNFTTADGLFCSLNPNRDTLRRNASGKLKVAIKCHWVPYHVDMGNALNQLEKIDGLKITGARYDTVRNDPLLKNVRTGVRTVWVEVDNIEKIPHKIEWQQGNQFGTALITVFGREVPCFRCWKSGHSRPECKEPKCDSCKKIGHFSQDCKGRTYAQIALSKNKTAETNEDEDMDLNAED
jgi:hypothetical protein